MEGLNHLTQTYVECGCVIDLAFRHCNRRPIVATCLLSWRPTTWKRRKRLVPRSDSLTSRRNSWREIVRNYWTLPLNLPSRYALTYYFHIWTSL